MARYFFDHSVGATIARDGIGAICASDERAVHHAWTALPHILSEHSVVLPRQHFELIVRREDGIVVGRLGMTVVIETQSPTTIAAQAPRGVRARAAS